MIEPVLLSFSIFTIYWYGVIYLIGFSLSFWFIRKYYKFFSINLSLEKVDNILILTSLFSLIGGRIFYIIFYNPSFYFSNPGEILKVYNGGMSIFGGIFFGFITLCFLAKKYKINLLKLLDLIVIPLSFALSLGRFGNFINQELVGITTTSKLGVIFPQVDLEKRFPYQIFASLKNFLVFQGLLYLKFYKDLKTGILTSIFLMGYGFGRFFLDFLRFEENFIFNLFQIGQWFSLLLGILGIILFVAINHFKNNKNKIK